MGRGKRRVEVWDDSRKSVEAKNAGQQWVDVERQGELGDQKVGSVRYADYRLRSLTAYE